MDQVTIKWKCEKRGTDQEKTLTWQPSRTLDNPAKGDQTIAQVECRQCGHKQILPTT